MDNIIILDTRKDTIVRISGLIKRIYCNPKIDISHTVAHAENHLIYWKNDAGVIILGSGFINQKGFSFIQKVKSINTETKVHIHTEKFSDDLACKAFFLGASSVSSPESSDEDIINCIKTSIKGNTLVPSKVFRKIISALEVEDRRAFSNIYSLTRREKEVLTLVAKGYKKREVAEILNIRLDTVKEYTKSTYRKLDVHNAAEAAGIAISLGLVNYC